MKISRCQNQWSINKAQPTYLLQTGQVWDQIFPCRIFEQHPFMKLTFLLMCKINISNNITNTIHMHLLSTNQQA